MEGEMLKSPTTMVWHYEETRLSSEDGFLTPVCTVSTPVQQTDGESGIDKVDPMIAAVADIYDEPVLTANTEHFDALEVDVEAY